MCEMFNNLLNFSSGASMLKEKAAVDCQSVLMVEVENVVHHKFQQTEEVKVMSVSNYSLHSISYKRQSPIHI